MMQAPILLYVQSLLGAGHFVRAQRLAEGLARAGAHAFLVNGSALDLAQFGASGLVQEWPVQPRLQAADDGFSGLVDEDRKPVSHLHWAKRQSCLQAMLDQLEPGLILVEAYPFARGQFHDEIAPWIMDARVRGWKIAGSVRDLIVAKSRPGWGVQVVERLNSMFDALLVHSDPDFMPLERSFPLAGRIRIPVHYTGYLAPESSSGKRKGEGSQDILGRDILVCAGSGNAAGQLFQLASRVAATGWGLGFRWQLFCALHSQPITVQSPNLVVHQQPVRDLPRRMEDAALIISQAGYNSCCELWRSRRPAVLVPFVGRTGTESEQPMRAKAMEESGHGRVLVAEGEGALRKACCDALALAGEDGRITAKVPALDGITNACAIIEDLLAQ